MKPGASTEYLDFVLSSQIVDLNMYSGFGGIREKILVVGQHPIPREKLTLQLASNYECVHASSAFEAFSILKEQTFAAVVTETMLPGLSGIELMRHVVRDYPDTAVIVLSEHAAPQRALDAVRLGAFDCLIKPFDQDVLQLTVDRGVERRNLLIEARRNKKDLEARNRELEAGKAKLQRLQAQIVHNEKMASLGQLAAGVAHELNNPVGFVYGNLDVLQARIKELFRLVTFYDYTELERKAASEVDTLKRDIRYTSLAEDINSMIADCLDGSTRIRDIVQNLRTFSRVDEAGLARTNINEGIDSTLRLLSKYFSSEKIDLIRDYGQLPEIDAFAGQLNQVWMNLLVNAAQSVGNVGEVRIQTRADDETIVVSISDTGCGIDAALISKIFDPFFTTKQVGEGSGLGLAISFGIIERHKGKIDVESQPGKGTTFRVTIPLNTAVHQDVFEAVNAETQYTYEETYK